MSGFLLLLIKVNLAMGAAIVLVSLIRRPLRAQFGAPIAYAIWLLVPIAGLASLLPPREVSAPAHVATVYAPSAPIPVTGHATLPARRVIEQLDGESALLPPTPVKPSASTHEMFDISLLLFVAWVWGTLFMAAYLIRVQVRFSAALRQGQAGPAVLGLFRPRIVTPNGFREQFTPQEQAAILAHESVHVARQDVRINALATSLRCLCWFNPLIHLGVRWLRIDQELACDAVAVSASVSHQTYAKALLKSQVMIGVLPFGCNWPGPQHPLVERIALLQRKPPGAARRLAGMSVVLLMATSAGLGAWAAQPPVPAKFIASRHLNNQVALATPPVVNPAPGQNAGEPVADANPVAGGDAAKNDQVKKPVSVVVPPEMPKVGSAGTQSAPPTIQDSLPEQKIDLALNEATGAAMAKAAADVVSGAQSNTQAQSASSAVAVTLNDQQVAPMPPATPASSAAPVQIAAAAPASANSGSVFAMEALSRGECQPAALGTVISVHTDPKLFGTDIVLDANDGAEWEGREWHGKEHTYIAFIPIGSVKNFPTLDTYVGQKVVIWTLFNNGGTRTDFDEITMPPRLQLLSAALSNPNKTWCYLPPGKNL